MRTSFRHMVDLAGGFLPGRGPEQIATFERALSAELGVDDVVLTGSGRQALGLLLRACELPPGGRVAIPALTLGALADHIRLAGLVPVAVDVDRDDFNITPRGLKEAGDVSAVIATHIFGAPCDSRGLAAAARERGAVLIEDCAHALGSRVGATPVGREGRGAIYSFETIKSCNAFGGGCVTTTDGELADRLRRLQAEYAASAYRVLTRVGLAVGVDALLASPLYGPLRRGMNLPLVERALTGAYLALRDRSVPQPSGLHPAQAAAGTRALVAMEQRNARCREIAERYRSELGQVASLQAVAPGATSNRYFAVFRLDEPARHVAAELARHGVDAGFGGEIVDDCSGLAGAAPCAIAADLHPRLLQLPCHHRLSDRDLDGIIDAARVVLGGSR